MHLKFLGKSHVKWERAIKDPQLAGVVRKFMRQPGERLFAVPKADGTKAAVTEVDVRKFVATYGGKPKDFRTFHANRLREEALRELPQPRSKAEAAKNLDVAIRDVAEKLGHTRAIDRASYQDPAALQRYLERKQ